MGRFQHSWPRRHVAEMNGEQVRFMSYHFDGSYGLWSDAVQACKNAGSFKRS